MSSVLADNHFSQKDIVYNEDYPLYPNQSERMILLADEKKLGLILAGKNKYGFWESEKISVATGIDPSDGQFVTVALSLIEDDLVESTTHLFVSFYIEKDMQTEIESPPNFDLSVEYFEINNRTLLLAHAITNAVEIDSDEVVSYLKSGENSAEVD